MRKAYKGWERFPFNVTPVVRGEDVALARRYLDASQEDFAKHMGVSSRTVKRWERDPKGWVRGPNHAREIRAILTFTDQT